MSRYIDEDMAVEAVADFFSKTAYTSTISYSTTAALILRKVPTAEVAPVVHGRWILKRFSDREHDVGTVCSVCRKAALFWTDYCPNCGAKMDGGEDD